MFDPLTVAFQINYPWGKSYTWPNGHKQFYRSPFITIWHKDPCKDGSDDSCDWFGSKRKLDPEEKKFADAVWVLESILDNRPFFPDHPAHKHFKPIKEYLWYLRKVKSWRLPVRWHIHHWRIQVHPWQQLKRFLFERCCKCGKGYSWGYSPIGNWSGDKTWHAECDDSSILKTNPVQLTPPTE